MVRFPKMPMKPMKIGNNEIIPPIILLYFFYRKPQIICELFLKRMLANVRAIVLYLH